MTCRVHVGAIVRSFSFLIAALSIASSDALSLHAATQLLAVTGQLQSGGSAEVLGVSGATINNVGDVAFFVTLKPDVGGVDSSNDRALWATDGATAAVIAQLGTTAAPGGGTFSSMLAASIGDGGEIALRGAAGGANGLWRFAPGGGGAQVARVGAGGVPGLPANSLDSISPSLLHAPGNIVAFNGVLALGSGVNTTNDRVVWIDASGAASLVAREQLSAVPGLSGAQFSAASPLAVNNQSQVVLLGALSVGAGGVTTAGAQGLFRVSPTGGHLIAHRSAGDVPDVPGAHYSSLDAAAINGAGQVAFTAQLDLAGEITQANRYGLWLSDGTTGALVARSGGNAAGAGAANFAQFGAPLLNDAGAILVDATLAVGAGGVTAENSEGLWTFDADSKVLLARTGGGGVPGVAGGSFAGFGALAFNSEGVAAVQATLITGVGGVSEANDQGLWLLDASGTSTLVAREGDVLAGRTVENLEFTGGSAGGDGHARSLNNSSQLVFKATFTNGDEGLFLYTPTAAPLAPADFNADGLVDGADLAAWTDNFGMSATAARAHGDADLDGDVDGGDFLLWQRQLGGQPPELAIPEPANLMLLLPAILVGVLRLSGGRQSSRAPYAACV